MVRQKSRKSIEELYGNHKFESNSSNSPLKTSRMENQDYGYLITSNTPYSTAPIMSGGVTTRRKTCQPIGTTGKADKLQRKDNKLIEDIKKEQQNMKQIKTLKGAEKCRYNSLSNVYNEKPYQKTLTIYNDRSKNIDSSDEILTTRQHQHHHQHHHHSHNHRNDRSHDDDKDDDTEEFFELIRHTVESSIKKSVSDLLNRNICELSAKVDKVLLELRNMKASLNELQTGLNNKIVHYGEENARHFRYLCMKSEYDKMFYQHQSMITAVSQNNVISPEKQLTSLCKNSSFSEVTGPVVDSNKGTTPIDPPCSCRGSNAKITINPDIKESYKSVSDEHNLSPKSSEMGMREVLEHIQRFCSQVQLQEFKCDSDHSKMCTSGLKKPNVIMNKNMFEEDDDLDISSDGMTPRSVKKVEAPKCVLNNEHGCLNAETIGTGGGDA